MSVDSGAIDRKDRHFFSGGVLNGYVGGVFDDDVLKDDELPDCPPGFENAVRGGLTCGRSAADGGGNGEMHGVDLCGMGDQMSFSSVSGTNFDQWNLVDLTKEDISNKSAVSDCKVEVLDKLNAAGMKRGKSGYVCSSLVWGNIRSHPWWPGQIFDPADSSKEALRHYKDGKLLVAYFGVGTFAWSDITQLKSFQLHFERMEGQSDSQTFCRAVDCALDEVFKRVEFGLSCACLAENVFADIQSQIVENPGVYKKSRRRDVGDECSGVECFVPSKLVSYIKEAATLRKGFVNRLELVKCKAQLTSFCRWKGYRKRPDFSYFRDLPKNNAIFHDMDGRDSHMAIIANNAHHMFPSNIVINEGQGEQRRGRPKGALTARQKNEGQGEHQVKRGGRHKGSSNARQNDCQGEQRVKRRGRPKGSSNARQNEGQGEHQAKRRGRPKGSSNARQNEGQGEHQTTRRGRPKGTSIARQNDCQGEQQVKRRGRPKGSLNARQKKKKKISDSADSDELYVPYYHESANRKAKHTVTQEAAAPENKIISGIRKSRRTNMDRITPASDSCITPTVEGNVSESLSPSGLVAQLALTALDPLGDHEYMIPLVKFFSHFRNSSCLNHPILFDPDKSPEENEMTDKAIPEYIYNTRRSEHVADSNCTDRIVEGNAADKCSMDSTDEPASIAAEDLTREVLPIVISETVPQLHIFSEPNTQYTSGNHEFAESILDTPSNQIPDSHEDESMMQTAFLLKFSEQSRVPSVTDLNKIFSCYGPLIESETKIMKRSVAKVIFKRSRDAEVAFSSTRKYSIFGPSLISYRLKYQNAKPKNISSPSRKRQKKAAPIDEGNPIPI